MKSRNRENASRAVSSGNSRLMQNSFSETWSRVASNVKPSRDPFVLIDKLECAVSGRLNLEAKATFEAVPNLKGLGLGAESGGVEW